MEDSSDDDDDEHDEEFYFYDGGWHSSPRPIKDLFEAKPSAKDSQALVVFDEGSAKDVDRAENINQSLLNNTEHRSAARVSDDQIKTAVINDDANNKIHGSSEFGCVENVQEGDVLVEVEISHDDDEEITENVEAVLLGHTGLKEETINEGDNDQQGHKDADVRLDLRMAETQTDSVVMKVETNNPPMGASNQVMIIDSIESVCESNEHLGGFKHKIRCWKRYVGGKIRGWSAKIRRTLTPCCINTRPPTTQ